MLMNKSEITEVRKTINYVSVTYSNIATPLRCFSEENSGGTSLPNYPLRPTLLRSCGNLYVNTTFSAPRQDP